jgi:hypothetical protein
MHAQLDQRPDAECVHGSADADGPAEQPPDDEHRDFD